MTRRSLLLAPLLFLLAGCADIAHQPWPDRVRDLTLAKATTEVDGIEVSLHPAEDMASGLCDIVVLETHTGTRQFLREPCAGLRLLTFHDGWPQLEIWSRGAEGILSRSLFRVTKGKYAVLRTDDFTPVEPTDRSQRRRHTTLPGERDPVYFVETHVPERAD